jgi:hypothetical protein
VPLRHLAEQVDAILFDSLFHSSLAFRYIQGGAMNLWNGRTGLGKEKRINSVVQIVDRLYSHLELKTSIGQRALNIRQHAYNPGVLPRCSLYSTCRVSIWFSFVVLLISGNGGHHHALMQNMAALLIKL